MTPHPAASDASLDATLLNRVVESVRQNETPLDSYEVSFRQSDAFYPAASALRFHYRRAADVVAAMPKVGYIEGRFWSKGNLKAVRYRPSDDAPKGKEMPRVQKTTPPTTPLARKQVTDGNVIVDMPLNADERQEFPADLDGVSADAWRAATAMGIGTGHDDDQANAAARQTIAANLRSRSVGERDQRAPVFANDPTRVSEMDPMRWLRPYGVALSDFLSGKSRSPDESVTIESVEACEVDGESGYRIEATYRYLNDRQSERVILIVNAERGYRLREMTVFSGNRETTTTVQLARQAGNRWVPTHVRRRVTEKTGNAPGRLVAETTVAFDRFKANATIPDSIFDGIEPMERRYRVRVLGLSIALIVMGILL
jgi:hypothetical protein